MTILDMLNKRYSDTESVKKALIIIKDNFTNIINENYQLVIDEKGELKVRIPSLEKRDEYVYQDISEYQYTLVMCMRISEMRSADAYNYILSKFMDVYKDRLEIFFKDVNTSDKLVDNIKITKSRVEYVTYAAIFGTILPAIFLCVFGDMPPMIKNLLTLVLAIFFILAIVEQCTKESKIRKVIDGYISLIKTDWYKKQLEKEYIFLCNFIE